MKHIQQKPIASMILHRKKTTEAFPIKRSNSTEHYTAIEKNVMDLYVLD